MPQSQYAELFRHLADQHDLLLLDSEMEEIVTLCRSILEARLQADHEEFLRELNEPSK